MQPCQVLEELYLGGHFTHLGILLVWMLCIVASFAVSSKIALFLPFFVDY